MSLFDYQQSRYLQGEGNFYSLLMAAMRCADSDNLRKLRLAFPEVEAELRERYNAPGGAIAADEPGESR